MGNIRAPDPENPRGYFEDEDFLDFGTRIYESADPESTGFEPPTLEAIVAQKDKFDQTIRSLVQRRSESNESEIWGWKAIHTSLTIGLFLPYLKNPHFIVVLRNPLDIARSSVEYTRYKAYEELSLFDGLQLSNFYYDHIYRLLEERPELPSIFVSFTDIIRDPQKTVRIISDFLDIEVTPRQLKEATQFVAPSERIRAERKKAKIRHVFRRIKLYLRRSAEKAQTLFDRSQSD
jgi:hypothetical protein